MITVETPETASNWIVEAKVGEMCVYYKGLLMRDRAYHDPATPMSYPLTVARKMWALNLTGRVTLLQQKLGPFDYLYIAQKVV